MAAEITKRNRACRPVRCERELRFLCSCGAECVVAYGFNAMAATQEKREQLAAVTGWALNPEKCPKCSGLKPKPIVWAKLKEQEIPIKTEVLRPFFPVRKKV